MRSTFTRTMASLETDRFAGGALWIGVIVALLASWGVWAVLARVTVYEVSVSARVEAEGGVITVASPVAGRVERVVRRVGDSVEAGDVLLELDASGERLRLEETMQERRGLVQELAQLDGELGAAQRALEAFRAAGEAEAGEARAHLETALAAARSAEAEAAEIDALFRAGSASQRELRLAVSAAEVARLEADAARASVGRVEMSRGEREADRLAGIASLGAERARVVARLDRLEATARLLEHEIELRRVRAPVAGVMADGAALTAGGVLGAGDRVASVAPRTPVVITALFHASDAAGRVRPGQRARVRLDGFPWSAFGTAEAVVTRVAQEPVDGMLRVELAADGDRLASGVALEHGLPGSVEVGVERVSPASLALRAAGRRIVGPGS